MHAVFCSSGKKRHSKPHDMPQRLHFHATWMGGQLIVCIIAFRAKVASHAHQSVNNKKKRKKTLRKAETKN